LSESQRASAAEIVAHELARREPADRPRFLRELLAHTAAGLVVLEGDKAAAEACYRLSDAVTTRGRR
jgi:hypothetical protein